MSYFIWCEWNGNAASQGQMNFDKILVRMLRTILRSFHVWFLRREISHESCKCLILLVFLVLSIRVIRFSEWKQHRIWQFLPYEETYK